LRIHGRTHHKKKRRHNPTLSQTPIDNSKHSYTRNFLLPFAELDNSKDKSTSKANQLYIGSELFSGKNKASQDEKPRPKGAIVGVKRDIMERFESKNENKPREDLHTQQIKPDVTIIKQSGTLLRKFMRHEVGWVFNTPVDIV